MQKTIKKNINLIYINFVKSISDIDEDIRKLETVIKKNFGIVTIVDNSFSLLEIKSQYKIIPGDNTNNEFSGIIAGLKYQNFLKNNSLNTLIINDTFNRNWNFNYLSKNTFKRLEKKSRKHYISLSYDNNIDLKKFKFKKNYNSRYIFVNNVFLNDLEKSIEKAIQDMNFNLKNNLPLHSEWEIKQINNFFNKNPDRFYAKKFESIFLERNMLSKIAKDNIYTLPKNIFSRLCYAILKKITNEKR